MAQPRDALGRFTTAGGGGGGGGSLSFQLFGIDVSASRVLREVAREAGQTGRALAGIGTTALKAGAALGAGLSSMAGTGQILAAVAPAALLAAPAIATLAQGMAVLKLAGDGVKKQFEQLQPAVQNLKDVAAGAIAPGIQDFIDSIRTNLPTVEVGVRQTAKTFGDLASIAGVAFSGPAFRADLATIMTANTETIGAFGLAAIKLGQAFVGVTAVAAPMLANLSGALVDGAWAVKDWVDQARASGQLQQILVTAMSTLGDVGAIVGNVLGTVGNVLGAVGSNALVLLGPLKSITQALQDWTSVPANLAPLVALVDGFRVGVEGLVTSFRAAMSGSGPQFAQLFTTMGTALSQVLPVLGTLAGTLLSAILPALNAILPPLYEFVAAFGTNLATVVEDLAPGLALLGEAIGGLLSALTGMGGELGAVVVLLAGLALAFGWPVAAAVAAGIVIVKYFDDIKAAAETVVGFFRDNPAGAGFLDDLKAAAQEVWPSIEAAFTKIKDAVLPVVTEIAAKIRDDLIPAFGNFVAAVAPVISWFVDKAGPMLATTFQNIFNIIKGAVDIIIGIFKVLAGVLTGDWKMVWDGIVSILQGAWGIITALVDQLWSGIKLAFSAAWDVLVAIVKGGIDAVLDFLGALGTGVVALFAAAGSWLLSAGSSLIGGLWSGIQTAWTAVVAFFSTVGAAIGAWFVDAFNWLLQAGTDLITGLWSGITTAWITVTTWALSLRATVIGWFVGALTWLLQAGSDLISGLWQGIQLIWTTVTTWAATIFTVVTGWFLGALTWLLQAGQDILTGLWDGIKLVWELVSTWFIEMTTVLIPGFFLDAISWLLQSGRDIIQGLWDGLVAIWEAVSGWFVNVTTVLIPGFFSGAISWLLQSGRDIIQGLLNGIQEIWGVANTWLSQIKTFVGDHFSGAIDWLKQAGINIVQGLINGMKSMLDAVGGAASDVAGAVKGFFQFSPAKEGPLKGHGNTYYSGLSMARSLAEGMLDNADLVRSAAATVAGLAGAGVRPALGTGPAYAMNAGGRWSAGGSGLTVVNYFTVNVAGSMATERGIAERLAPLVRDSVANGASSNGRRTGLPR